MKKRLVVVGLVLMIGVLLAGCGDNVATVNGEKLKQNQLDKVVNLFVVQAQQTYGTDPREDAEFMEQIREAALESLIDQTLLLQEAARQGMEATEEEVSTAIDQFKEAAGTEGFKGFLSSAGYTEEEFEEEMHNQVLIDELYEKVMSGVEVTVEEVKKFYEDYPEYFGNPYELRVSHILLDTKAEAEDVIKRLKDGEDFAELAKELSTEQNAQESGGDLGFINEQTNFVNEFKTAALKLKPGEMTEEPVQSEFGFHVIKAFEERAAKIEAFEQVKDQAQSLTLRAKEEQAWQDLIEKLRSEGDIKTN
ncbi:MAG: hypothetical protein GXY50_04945 [Syntrophomonadaceae bacterium]|nr:hypothetical protein [Syntrophomonadaceae bacterium]